ncbi:hypothetical protein [Streptomyces sp. ID05-39B]|uniref:hypothetical protein n=1 Tax=Streptomyces sp. ID05-39B TaxID=3028664 RepID=UPI0029C007DE|nr:hypothetical protein [Streptomyces sp. ID05-39B]
MARCRTFQPGRPGPEDLVRAGLSAGHRGHPGAGCPSAALLDETGRQDGTKRAYTDGARALIDAIAARPAPEDPRAARGKAIGLSSMLVGTVQLSRALSDRRLADETLAQGIKNALTFTP